MKDRFRVVIHQISGNKIVLSNPTQAWKNERWTLYALCDFDGWPPWDSNHHKRTLRNKKSSDTVTWSVSGCLVRTNLLILQPKNRQGWPWMKTNSNVRYISKRKNNRAMKQIFPSSQNSTRAVVPSRPQCSSSSLSRLKAAQGGSVFLYISWPAFWDKKGQSWSRSKVQSTMNTTLQRHAIIIVKSGHIACWQMYEQIYVLYSIIIYIIYISTIVRKHA